MLKISPGVIDKIHDLVATHHPDAFIVDVKMKRIQRDNLVIRVDTDLGINLDECREISRTIGRWLDEEEPFEYEYNLEVTSPGLGEPLLLPRQYKKEIGRKFKVILLEGAVFEGKLTAASETDFTIELEKPKKKKEITADEDYIKTFAYDSIKEAKVIPSLK